MNTDNSQIIQYIRDRKNRRKGVIVASLNSSNGIVTIGWSMKHKNDTEFNRDLGLKIAINRCFTGTSHLTPQSIRDDIYFMYDRAVKYFKDKVVIIPSDL